MLEKRQDPVIDDQVNAYRIDTISGEKKNKPKATKVRTVETGDRQFDRNFITGTWQSLERFAKMRNIRYSSMEELAATVRVRYPDYRIAYNKAGDPGVEIVDQNEGEFRFERGHDEYAEQMKLQTF